MKEEIGMSEKIFNTLYELSSHSEVFHSRYISQVDIYDKLFSNRRIKISIEGKRKFVQRKIKEILSFQDKEGILLLQIDRQSKIAGCANKYNLKNFNELLFKIFDRTKNDYEYIDKPLTTLSKHSKQALSEIVLSSKDEILNDKKIRFKMKYRKPYLEKDKLKREIDWTISEISKIESVDDKEIMTKQLIDDFEEIIQFCSDTIIELLGIKIQFGIPKLIDKIENT